MRDMDCEGFGEMSLSYQTSLCYSWHHVLLRAGMEGDAGVVDQVIKESKDRVKDITWSAFNDPEDEGEYPCVKDLLDGAKLVAQRLEAGEWKTLPNTVKVHKKKKVKDRRF